MSSVNDQRSASRILPSAYRRGRERSVKMLVSYLQWTSLLFAVVLANPARAHQKSDKECVSALEHTAASGTVAYQFFWLPPSGRINVFTAPMSKGEQSRLRSQVFAGIKFKRMDIDPVMRRVLVVFSRQDLAQMRAIAEGHSQIVAWTDFAELDNRMRGKKIERRLLRSLLVYPGGSVVRVLVTLPLTDAVTFAEALLMQKLSKNPQEWPHSKRITGIRPVPSGHSEQGSTGQNSDLWEMVLSDSGDRMTQHLALLPGQPGRVFAELLSVY